MENAEEKRKNMGGHGTKENLKIPKMPILSIRNNKFFLNRRFAVCAFLVVTGFCSFTFRHPKELRIMETINHNNPPIYKIPTELLYTGKKEVGHFPDGLYPRIYPIGWSRDGKFAYIIEPADEACGCYFFSIFIQDVTNNKMVWQWHFEGEEGGNETLKIIWNQHKTIFGKKLASNGIIQSPFKQLQKLPVIVNRKTIDFFIKNDTFFSEDFGLNVIKKCTVYKMINKKNGPAVFSQTYAHKTENAGNKLFSTTLRNKIWGYLHSPYDKKFVLFYETEDRGWEGPPNVMNLELVAINLDTGFD
jgi:hypothetical protein